MLTADGTVSPLGADAGVSSTPGGCRSYVFTQHPAQRASQGGESLTTLTGHVSTAFVPTLPIITSQTQASVSGKTEVNDSLMLALPDGDGGV